jgi:hypothetical protein
MLDDSPQTPSRRRFIGVASASVAATSLSRLAFAEIGQSMTDLAPLTASDRAAIHPMEGASRSGSSTQTFVQEVRASFRPIR